MQSDREGGDPSKRPRLYQVVLDTTDARELAEFYRELLGWRYHPGHEPPPQQQADPAASDWLKLENPAGGAGVAFQPVPTLPRATWPEGPIPQQLHLDLMVDSLEELLRAHARVLALGGSLLQDRRHQPEEPLVVFADPAGHPFCIFCWPTQAASFEAQAAL